MVVGRSVSQIVVKVEPVRNHCLLFSGAYFFIFFILFFIFSTDAIVLNRNRIFKLVVSGGRCFLS